MVATEYWHQTGLAIEELVGQQVPVVANLDASVGAFMDLDMALGTGKRFGAASAYFGALMIA